MQKKQVSMSVRDRCFLKIKWYLHFVMELIFGSRMLKIKQQYFKFGVEIA